MMTAQFDHAQLSDYLDFAHHLADLARHHTCRHFRSTLVIDTKDAERFDPVTEADRKAEEAMRTEIQSRFPDHGIQGEEFAQNPNPDAKALQWILDPIDGTRAYIAGKPNWGTLIGLYAGDDPVLGLVDMPALDERLWAGRGLPAQARKADQTHDIATRACTLAKDAVLATTSPEFFAQAEIAPLWAQITDRVRMTLYGGDCTNYALLAAGHIDMVIERDLKPYDILPLRGLIEAAGGVMTDWNGAPVTQGGHVIACGDRALHEAIMPILRTGA